MSDEMTAESVVDEVQTAEHAQDGAEPAASELGVVEDADTPASEVDSEAQEGNTQADGEGVDGEGVDAESVESDGDDADAEEADAEEADAEDAEEAGTEDAEEAGTGKSPSRRDEALTSEGEIAADYIEGLLDIADLDGDIDTYNEGGRAHVSVITESNVLVGKTGDVLEALQELCRLAVMTETGHRSRLMLDIAGHRDRRRGQLQALAAEAIAEVGRSGESVRLAPMNPFERKIVHDVIAAAGLVSESEGEEPNRRVVVMPKA